MIAFAVGLLFGAAGSLHCAAMCGPLVAVADGATTSRTRAAARWRSRAAYHGGRIGVYALGGVVVGFGGAALEGQGLGRALAVTAGLALVAQACVAAGVAAGADTAGASSRLAGALSRAAGWLRRRGLARPELMGALNGLLPCGLVYAALVAAGGAGGVTAALSLMIGFGLGTLPALLGVGAVSAFAAGRGGPGLRRVAVPAALGIAGCLLIARGLGSTAAHRDHFRDGTPAAALPAPAAAVDHGHR